MKFKTQHIFIAAAAAAIAFWAWDDLKKKGKRSETAATLRVIQDTPQMAESLN